MVRYFFCCLLCYTCFSSVAVEQIDAESAQSYKVKWKTVSLDAKGFDFHKVYAKRLAINRVHLGLKDQSNLAIIGLSLHNADNCIYVAFPHIIYSTYNTLEDEPSVDDDGVSFVSIADMMRADIMRGRTRVHQISDFLFCLFSFNYTRDWGLYSGITKCSEIIERAKPKEMAKIPGDTSISEVLHCEQVFLYRALMNSEVFDLLVADLLKQDKAIDFLKSQNSYITLDIMTYNDMCPKCFSTCHHGLEILSAKINEAIIRKTRTDKTFSLIFTARGGKPFDISIQVSSFRPYSTIRRVGEGSYWLYDKSEYVYDMTDPNESQKIVQFFNPWMAQHIFDCEFSDFIKSVGQLEQSEVADAYIIGRLLKTLKVLWNDKKIEPQIVDKVLHSFLENVSVFLKRPELSFSILPLAIGLYNITQKSDFLAFIERSIGVLDKTGTEMFSGDLKKVVSVSDNQNAIVNTVMLMQASVPDGGWYNFEEMGRIANLIKLTKDVHPVIVIFIKNQVAGIRKKIKKKKNLPGWLESELARILK